MVYTPTTWVSGTTALSAAHMNNLETQYTDAVTSFNQDLFTGFVLSGYAASKDISIANQLDVTSGVAYLVQSDGTTLRTAITSSTQTTATPSSTYHLYLQPAGTWYWSTSNSPAANSLFIAQVATDGSGNILTVTDERPTNASMFSTGINSTIFVNGVGLSTPVSGTFASLTWNSTTHYLELETQQTGASNGFLFVTWNGSATASAFGVGGTLTTPIGSPTSWVSNAGDYVCGGYFASAGGSSGYKSQLSGAASGHAFVTWTGAASATPFSIGVTSGLAYIDNLGDLYLASGVVGEIDGQLTAGNFGVAPIVAQALSQSVITTGDHTILSFNTPANGLYRVSGYVEMNGTNSGAIIARFTYADDLGTPTAYMATSAGAGASPLTLNGSNTFGPSFSGSLLPVVVYAKSTANIICHYNSPNGTPADHIWFLIERLA